MYFVVVGFDKYSGFIWVIFRDVCPIPVCGCELVACIFVADVNVVLSVVVVSLGVGFVEAFAVLRKETLLVAAGKMVVLVVLEVTEI